MTEDKTAAAAETKAPEKIIIREGEFEALLTGCIWDILKRMRQVIGRNRLLLLGHYALYYP